MKHLTKLTLLGLLSLAQAVQAQPTDNPVASQYGDGYPLWTDSVQWNNVFDATSYGAVADGDAVTNGVANFNAFEAARDAAAAAGGGVVYFPAGTYYFRLPDPDGVGYGIGPNSRGLMLKDGVVIRGADIPVEQRSAIIRTGEDPQTDEFLNVTHNLQPLTKFVFEFQTRGTDPATDILNSAGEVPMDWNFIGAVAPTGDLTTTEVVNPNNLGIVNVELEGATVFFNYHTPRSATLATGKWLSQFKVDFPKVGADWASRVPDGTHIMESISGSAGWHTEVSAGSGRLVMNVKISDGTPLNDALYIGRNTSNPVEGFAEYRFTGRIVAHGSDIFIANNVIDKPTRNFGHKQLTSAGSRTVLFDYANTIGIDVNKSNLGGNQDALTVAKTLGSGYFWENVVIRDNWVFSRGNKGFETSGYHMQLLNNHNERYYNHLTIPDVSYVANAEAAYGVTSGSITLPGVIFDGYTWQTSESASDFMSRGYDLGGYSTYLAGNSVINTGSIGNDGEGLLGQRHNNMEIFGWALVGNQNGTRNLGPGTSGEPGYIGPYDMHAFGLLLMNNRSTGAVGILKEAANYQVDVTNLNNTASSLPGGTSGTGPIDMYKEGSGGTSGDPVKEVHTDAVTPPSSVTATAVNDEAIDVEWNDAADNELGFRIERSANGGPWETIVYRPMNGATLDAVDPGTTAQAWVFTPINELNPQLWRDFLIVPGVSYEYRVVAFNANDDDSTGVSDPSAAVSVGAPPAFSEGSLDVDGLVAGAIDGQDNWSYTADGAARLQSDNVAVTAGGLDWVAADGGTIAAGTQHLYTQAGIATNGKMDRWLSYSPVAISGPAYVRFLATMETRPEGSSIGATDPYELFFGLTDNAAINGAPWNGYVALKRSVDGTTVGVETTNSGGVLTNEKITLDTPMLVVAKYETDVDGKLVGIKVWLNPNEADEGTPDHTITFDAPGVVLSEQDHLKLRMQNMPARIDHLLVASTWAEVVPEAAVIPFPGLFIPFDNYSTGALDGQDDWTVDAADSAKVSVSKMGLNYVAPDQALLDAGTQHLILSGSPVSKMNSFATRPIDPAPTGSTYFRVLMYSSSKGISTDPGELFLRLAGWDLFVAAKYYAGIIELTGGNILEVDTTNGLPTNQTHMILLKLNADGGVVTGMDLWLNPSFPDSESPDLSVSGLSLDIATVSQIEVRSQNTLIRVDEIALAETWDELVPQNVDPFESLVSSFDDLSLGEINGQGDWTIDAVDAPKANVADGALTYLAPDGAELVGGTQDLVLSGSPEAKMNNWLTLPIVPQLDQTTYFRALVRSSDAGVAGSPAELFIRLAGWNLYVGAKFTAGVIELPGPNILEVDTTNGLPLDVTHMLLLRMNLAGGMVVSLDFWLNPEFGDESNPDLTINPLNLDLSSISQIELRSQNTTTQVDEILLAESWAEVVPEATTPVAPIILADPVSTSVILGKPIQLNVFAAGTPALTYQWRKDGTIIDGATQSSYSIQAADLTDSGSYDVVVTNAQGSATSDPAIIDVSEEVFVPKVTLFEETFDSGTEPGSPVLLSDLGWNVHHSYAGVSLDGLSVDPENVDETARTLVFETSTESGDFNIGDPYGYQGFFINNYPLYGRGVEGDRPALPGPHPVTGEYYHNRTLATFLWKDAAISEADRSIITNFNFVQGNRDGSQHTFFPAVQIDGQWYVYIVDPVTLGTDVRILGRPGQNDPNGAETVFSGSQFSEGGAYANYYNAQPYHFAWSETGWTELVFDGGNGTNSTVGMTLGDPVDGELPMSAITAVGVYSPENIDPGYNFNGLRIDSIEILGVAVQEDLFTFTFNNEGTVNGSDRSIQAADWDGLYSTAALPLLTNAATFADLSEGVSDDTTPGSYKAGFLFVSGKNDQPAPDGFLIYSTNTNVVDVPQVPQGAEVTVNPQTDWYSDPTNAVTNLNQLLANDLGELQMRIKPRNVDIRYHFALKIAGEWYVSADSFQHSGVDPNAWESVSLDAGSANWLSGVVGEGSINFDFTAVAPAVVKLADLASGSKLETVGIYIDTDDGIGTTDTWARVDSITLASVVPALTAPVISEQPAAVAVTAGGTAEFTVAVESPDGVTYQWRKDEVDLEGETAAILTLASVTEADEGSYDVVVTGPGGSSKSQPAALTVYAIPVLDQVLFNVDAGAHDLQIFLTTEANEVTWDSAVSQDDWITITYAGGGTGPDLILFSVAANPDYLGRSGSFTVAGQTVTVNQEGKPIPASFEEVVGAVDNQDGTFTSSWFGTYTSPMADWIIHEGAGLLNNAAVAIPTDMFMYSVPLKSWVWTNETAFPIMYEYATGEWIYYEVINGVSFVYSYSTDTWSY